MNKLLKLLNNSFALVILITIFISHSKSFSFDSSNNFIRKTPIKYSNLLYMSSVSPASRPSEPSRSAGFIISPSSKGSENELLILQNFNQIQYGEKLKFGVIGTQDLSNSHKQMVELLSYALILSGNHVYTSAGSINGTNLAVIQGALRCVQKVSCVVCCLYIYTYICIYILVLYMYTCIYMYMKCFAWVIFLDINHHCTTTTSSSSRSVSSTSSSSTAHMCGTRQGGVVVRLY